LIKKYLNFNKEEFDDKKLYEIKKYFKNTSILDKNEEELMAHKTLHIRRFLIFNNRIAFGYDRKNFITLIDTPGSLFKSSYRGVMSSDFNFYFISAEDYVSNEKNLLDINVAQDLKFLTTFSRHKYIIVINKLDSVENPKLIYDKLTGT
jgi:translation elongation factor EF-1alpha